MPVWILPSIGAALGFVLAWTVQGVRLDNAKLDHEKYVVELNRKHNDAVASSEQQRQETSDAYQKRLAQLKNDHDAYRRCVAAGKCGVRAQVPAPAPACEVPATGRVDEARPDPVPAPAASSEAVMGVVGDCAITTLMLNTLQDDIEKQLRR